VVELARESAISEAALCGWKSNYGRMEPGEAQRLRVLMMSPRLKHFVADVSLDKKARPSYEKTGGACRLKSGCGVGDSAVWHERTRGLPGCGGRPQQLSRAEADHNAQLRGWAG